VSTKESLDVGAATAMRGFKVGDRLPASHDREVLSAMFDGIEEVCEVTSSLRGGDLRHELRLSDSAVPAAV
jgi:hypothetical protein